MPNGKLTCVVIAHYNYKLRLCSCGLSEGAGASHLYLKTNLLTWGLLEANIAVEAYGGKNEMRQFQREGIRV